MSEGQFSSLGMEIPRQGSQRKQMLKTKGQTQVAMAKSGDQVSQVTWPDCYLEVRNAPGSISMAREGLLLRIPD